MSITNYSQDSNKLNDTQQQQWAEQINHTKLSYEAQLSELRRELEQAKLEKSEAEASKLKYDTMSAEFETRLYFTLRSNSI